VGLFRRKHRQPDFIDLGGDWMAISPERADEWADAAAAKIMDVYDEVAAAEVNEALEAAVRRRHANREPSRSLGGWLMSVAGMGYAARQYEESFESVESNVPVLAEQLQEWLDAGETVVGALTEVSLALCDSQPDDPSAPRSLDAIPGLDDIRDMIRARMLTTAAGVSQHIGLAEQGGFPEGIEVSEVVATWNLGFLMRSCESSLPDDVMLTADTTRHLVAVDIRAVESAFEEWLVANPDPSEAACSQMTRELIEDPRFHFDPDKATENDDEARYSLFEFDRRGHMIPQEKHEFEGVGDYEDVDRDADDGDLDYTGVLAPSLMLDRLPDYMQAPIGDDLEAVLVVYLEETFEDVLSGMSRSTVELLLNIAWAGYCGRSIAIDQVEAAREESPVTRSLLEWNQEQSGDPMFTVAVSLAGGSAGLEGDNSDLLSTKAAWITIPGVATSRGEGLDSSVAPLEQLSFVGAVHAVEMFSDEEGQLAQKEGMSDAIAKSVWLFGYFLRVNEQYSPTSDLFAGAWAYIRGELPGGDGE
jgi:hypothetical protein